jgi:hypothetical protein
MILLISASWAGRMIGMSLWHLATGHFLMEHHFYLKEWLMSKVLFRLRYLADIFSKMNEVRLLLHEK